MLPVLLLAIVLLLLLNAFFALAEFAAVKVRSTWVEELERRRHPRAQLVRHLHEHLDEYLSAVQVGITFTSIGLGFVGEPAMAELLTPLLGWLGGLQSGAAHAAAIVVGYLLISFLHVVLGELVPKGLAVRAAERTALWIAAPMRFFYVAFHVPRIVLHRSAHLVLRLLGAPERSVREALSEVEIRSMLGHSQSSGMMSLRRLLILENVLDFGALRVGDAMRPRSQVAFVRPEDSTEHLLARFAETRFSRYPLASDQDRVVGIVSMKDVLTGIATGRGGVRLGSLARPCLETSEDEPLEGLFAELQRRRQQMAVVVGPGGGWMGIVTMEDILEEIVGSLGDEFEAERPIFLADLLPERGVLLDLAARDLTDGVLELAARAGPTGPGFERLVDMLREREALMPSYVGLGVAIPHVRLARMEQSMLLLGRSTDGMATGVADQRAHLVFLVLTPSGRPGEHVRIVARIAVLCESESLLRRLREAATPEQAITILREGDPSVNPA